MDYGDLAQVVRRTSWTDFLAAPERGHGRLLLFTTAAATSFLDFAFAAGDTLLFGSESAGAPAFVHDAAAARLVIPIAAPARSLNLVTAATLALGEGLRQTKGFPAGGGVG